MGNITKCEPGFTDPFIFAKVLELRPDIAKRIVELVTGRKVAAIKAFNKSSTDGFVEGEKTIKTSWVSKGVRLDTYFEDENDVAYNLEMQTTSTDNLPKRIRYYQSKIDGFRLKPGERYSYLPETFIIFICTFDPFKESLPKYELLLTRSTGSSEPVSDGAHKIVLNSTGLNTYEDSSVSTELSAFLRFINGEEVDDPLCNEIQSEVNKILKDKDWRQSIMTVEEEMWWQYFEGETKGKAEGLAEGQTNGINLALQAILALNSGQPIEEVSQTYEIPLDKLQAIVNATSDKPA